MKTHKINTRKYGKHGDDKSRVYFVQEIQFNAFFNVLTIYKTNIIHTLIYHHVKSTFILLLIMLDNVAFFLHYNYFYCGVTSVNRKSFLPGVIGMISLIYIKLNFFNKSL